MLLIVVNWPHVNDTPYLTGLPLIILVSPYHVVIMIPLILLVYPLSCGDHDTPYLTGLHLIMW